MTKRVAVVAVLVAIVFALVRAWRTPDGQSPVSASPRAVGEHLADVGTHVGLPSPPSVVSRAERAPAELAERSAAPARQLTVRVVDETGTAIEGIAIELRFESDSRQWIGAGPQSRTGKDGECVLDFQNIRGEVGSWILVRVEEPEGYVDRTPRLPVGTEHVEVALVRGGRLHGRVRYFDGAPPGEHARVYVYSRDESGAETFESTDVVDGAYDFGFALSGTQSLAELENPGHPIARWDFPDFELAPGDDVEGDLIFNRGSSLALEFRDAATRAPIPGAWVVGLGNYERRSDAQGRLLFEDALCAGCGKSVQLVHPDYVAQWRRLAAPANGAPIVLQVDMTHGVELAGVVQDDLGAPQPFVLVRVEQTLGERLDDDELEGFATRTRTDGDGAFRIGGLPPRGAFALSVWSRAEQLIACETIEMPAAAQRRVWTVPKGTSIDGRVIDESGEPLQNAFVRASLAQIDCYRTARTRRDGRFRIDGAVPGRWNLGVEYGESSRLAIANEPVRRLALVALDVPPDGARDVEVRLSSASDMWRLRSVRVRFFDARNGSEVDDVEWIQWAGIDSTFERGVPGSRLRGDGLRVALAVGSYDVGVRSIGYAPKAMRIEVLDGDGVQDVVVDLEPED